MKIIHDNYYLESQEKTKTMDEQIRELKRIIPEQGIFKRRIEQCLSHWISIKDRRHRSMASSFGATFPFTNDGMEVVSIDVIKKEIDISDSSLFPIIKDFAEKWGYETIHTKYQI
jgi:hypothetical protein